MTEEQREISLQTKRLGLSFWGKVSHFGIVGFMFFIPLMFVFLHLKDALNGTPKPTQAGEAYFLIIPTLLAIVFYKLQSDRLKFTEIHTTLPRQQLNDIIEKVGSDLKWSPDEINDEFIIVKTHPSFLSGSWGEQITILFDTNRVLVNSICDPDNISSVVSMGRNKKNENRLIEEIQNASR